MGHQAHQYCFLQGAGYSSGPRGRFDPLNQAATGRATTTLAKVEEASPDEQCRDAEAKVHVALDESAQALQAQDASTGEVCRASCAVMMLAYTPPRFWSGQRARGSEQEHPGSPDARRLTGLGCAGLHVP